MLIFRVFTDAGCGGIRYPEVSDYRPQPLGYSYASLSRASHDCWGAPFRGDRCARPSVIASVKPRRAKGSYASLSRASHDWRGGGGGSLPALYETVLRTVSHAFCY